MIRHTDREINALILKTFLDEEGLGLQLVSVKADGHPVASKYIYCFEKKGSGVTLEFSITTCKRFIPSLWIYKVDVGCLIFDDFLDHVEMSEEERVKNREIYKKYFLSRDIQRHKKYTEEYLKLIMRYLKDHLKKVISGQEWIEIPSEEDCCSECDNMLEGEFEK